MRFKLDPFSSCLFVFYNRNRNRIKILEWEYTGFWLHLKRLEKGKWPNDENEVKNITQRELRWLLDGLSTDQPKAHKEVKQTTVPRVSRHGIICIIKNAGGWDGIDGSSFYSIKP